MAMRYWTTALAATILLTAACATPSEPVPTVTAVEPAVTFLIPECEDPNGCEEPPPPPPPTNPPNCPTSALVYAGSATPSGATTVAVTVEAPHTISSTCANYTVWRATVDGVERADATYHWYYGVCRGTQNPDGTWANWNYNWCTTDQFTLVDSGLGKSRFTIPVWLDVRNVFVYVEVGLGSRTGVSGAVKSRGPLNGLHPEPNPSRDIKNCGVFGLPHRYYVGSQWRAFGRNYCTGQDSSVAVDSLINRG
jgi:hypothetical protein